MEHEFFGLADIQQNKKYDLGEALAEKVFVDNSIPEETIADYYSKLDYNQTNNEHKLMLSLFIKDKDITNVFNYLKNQPFYCTMDDLTLYIYTRRLCNKPIKKSEIKRILKLKHKLTQILAEDPLPKIIYKQKTFLHF